MQVYKIIADKNLNWEWRAVLKESEDKKFSLIQNLNSDKPLDISDNTKIEIFLINSEPDKSLREKKPFDSDIIYWTDDITLKAFKANKGVIISKDFSKILKKYRLPEYKLYPLKIVNNSTSEVNLDYFLLQIYGNINDFTIFSESEYGYRKLNSLEIQKKEIGLFNDFENFASTKRKLRKEEKIIIEISKRKLISSIDIYPGESNNVIVSEQLLKEKQNLKGVLFQEIKDFIIKE